jgi:uncharacterized protein
MNLKGVRKQMSREKLNTRDFKTQFTITRATETSDEKIIEGYFSLFNNETELYPGIFEIISPGAFDKTLNNDVRALWNHNSQYVLGRSKNGTLTLKTDDKGLFCVVKLPDTQYAEDLHELIQRGDVDQCSFGFNILDEDLEELADGGYRWRINEVDLHEVSVVTFPAYENTSVLARSKQVEEIEKRKLETKKAEVLKRLERFKKC